MKIAIIVLVLTLSLIALPLIFSAVPKRAKMTYVARPAPYAFELRRNEIWPSGERQTLPLARRGSF
jgi:hypothetical protein